MNNKEKAKIILRILNKTYPKIPIPLNYKNTFTLLISVLLSAQCTDVNVNNVTKDIYPKYNKPEHFIKLGRRKIERLIKRIGIFRVKAKSIFHLSKKLFQTMGLLFFMFSYSLSLDFSPYVDPFFGVVFPHY